MLNIGIGGQQYYLKLCLVQQASGDFYTVVTLIRNVMNVMHTSTILGLVQRGDFYSNRRRCVYRGFVWKRFVEETFCQGDVLSRRRFVYAPKG
jgi:hypothetical protein